MRANKNNRLTYRACIYRMQNEEYLVYLGTERRLQKGVSNKDKVNLKKNQNINKNTWERNLMDR